MAMLKVWSYRGPAGAGGGPNQAMFRRGIAPLIIAIIVAVAAIGGGVAVHAAAKGGAGGKGPPLPDATFWAMIGTALDSLWPGASLVTGLIGTVWGGLKASQASAATTAAGELHLANPAAAEHPSVSDESYLIARRAARKVSRKRARAAARAGHAAAAPMPTP